MQLRNQKLNRRIYIIRSCPRKQIFEYHIAQYRLYNQCRQHYAAGPPCFRYYQKDRRQNDPDNSGISKSGDPDHDLIQHRCMQCLDKIQDF